MQNRNAIPLQVDLLVGLFNSLPSGEQKEQLLAYLQQLDYRITAGLCQDENGDLYFDKDVCQEALCRARTREEAQVIMELFVQLFKASDALGQSVNELKGLKSAAAEDVQYSINVGLRGADEENQIISNCSVFIAGLKELYDEITSSGGLQFGPPAYETE